MLAVSRVRRPLITIALPVRNSAATLAEAIASIQWQTYERWELIIADDGSDDDSAAIAEKAAKVDNRIQTLRADASEGIARRMNEIIDQASGELIARMDGDDVSYPLRLETQVRYLTEHSRVDVLGSAMLVFKSDGTALGVRRGPTGHETICRHPGWGFRMFQPTLVARASWLRRHRYRLKGCEDQELLLRAYRESCYANLPEVLIGYRQDRVPLRKNSRNRIRFAHVAGGAMIAEGRTRAAASAVVKQLTLGIGDAAAVALGAENSLLRQRARRATDEESSEWNAVWAHLREVCHA